MSRSAPPEATTPPSGAVDAQTGSDAELLGATADPVPSARLWGGLLGVACASTLVTGLVTSGADPIATAVICLGCLVVAAVIAVVAPSARTLSSPYMDLACAALLTLILYLTGGLASLAYPLVLLLVLLQGVARPPRRLVWRLLTPTAVAMTPLVYQGVAADQGAKQLALMTACVACSLVFAIALFSCDEALRRLHAHSSWLASIDPLTGLANRRAFGAAVNAALEAGERFAVVMIDLDNFSGVNTSRGHQAGDVLLQEVAGALDSVTRSRDCLARVGGDEFAALLSGVDEHAAREIAGRFLATVRRCTRGRDEVTARVGASAGFALYPDHGATRDALLRRADAALMTMKAGSKHAVAHRAAVSRSVGG